MILNISEIFYSLQGEGSRAGEPSIFVRLQGCKAQHACLASGVMCDTEFESGKPYTLEQLMREVETLAPQCKTIVWTGGEPAQQLTEEVVGVFALAGYYQCIETSGLFMVPSNIDFITLSPKVAEHVIKKNFEGISVVNEIKYVRHAGQDIPAPSIPAQHYFISPHSNGNTIDYKNLQHCINLCLENPKWKLSLQMHKLWKVL
jgi:organic radical activating enzyme